MKKTNWMLAALMMLAITVAVLGVSGCKFSCYMSQTKSAPASTMESHAMKYYCPMHPEVVTDAPGKCPKCSMDLVEKP